jgi:preprotein translocase subunit SecG
MTALYVFAIVFFLIVALVLCAVILMQESKSSGLGASFGGGDPTSSVFGTSTADVLKKFTGWMVALFFTLCIILSLWTSALSRHEFSSHQVPVEEIESI